MAHYDCRVATASDFENQCKNIASIINTNYSSYLTAEATTYVPSGEAWSNEFVSNGWIVKISIAKGNGQGDLICVYGNRNNDYGALIYTLSDGTYHYPNGSTAVQWSESKLGDNKVFCLDILEIDNGVIFGFYGQSQESSMSAHGYRIEKIIAYNENNDYISINTNSANIYIDKGNSNIYNSYAANSSNRFATESDVVQFVNLFDGEKFFNNVNFVTIGQSAATVPDIRKFTVNNQEYYYLGSLMGSYSGVYKTANSKSWVFPLPSQSS